MKIQFSLNGKKITEDSSYDPMNPYEGRDPRLKYTLYTPGDELPNETSNCGLCTVLMDGKPVLSCTTLAVRANGKEIFTLEGLQKEAEEFGSFLADQGADQCGFCNPGFIVNVIAMTKELQQPDEQEIKEYLEGNLCRCTGYQGHLRAVQSYLQAKQAEGGSHE